MNDFSHQYWMEQALLLADKAEAQGEVPVGAIVVYQDRIVGEGWNQTISLNDASAHAEILALRAAGKTLGNYRLLECSLYVTLEPCAMCAGAMVHARIKQLVYGAKDAKTGAAGSVFDIVRHQQLNHHLDVVDGVLAEPCADKLSNFFRRRRSEIKAARQLKQTS